MGNQCCCEDDPSGKPLDANVLVWRPETQPGKRVEPTAADLLLRDRQLDAALDKIARHQPDEVPPQGVPRAALMESGHQAHSSADGRGFEEDRPAPEAMPRTSRGADSNEGLQVPSADSSRYDPGDVRPTHQVQWVTQYAGDVAEVTVEARVEQKAEAQLTAPPSVEQRQTAEQWPTVEQRLLVELRPPAHAEPPIAELQPTDRHSEELKPAEQSQPTWVHAEEKSSEQAELAKTDMKAVASRDAGYQEVQVEHAQPAEHGIDADVPGATDDDLPLLLVRFRLEDGSFQDVYFFAAPFGFDLTKKQPLTVRGIKPGSYAEQLGVEVGWVVHQVADVDVSNMSAPEMVRVLIEQKKKILGN
ncbi:unnamed protein product [Effrenium voratum]|uniref:Uncharacterized protein n=1 Tax=Effrenium voratum TaxID=2562239 RepID=A0AA36MPC0_9DINO|nr:unnamed protein product [Effrenium voratum]CAJ1380265.1 unnamed protein product [Effrenium voratum]CAJ1432983.1 unnamed protein product [Effrenium voratum]